MNTVAYTDNGIKVINSCRAILVLSIMQNLHITIFFKFTFFQGILNMTGYNRLILLVHRGMHRGSLHCPHVQGGLSPCAKDGTGEDGILVERGARY